MALVAGVDIGNSTTEIVIADGLVPIAWDRRPTRGPKGSLQSIQAAAALLRNIERNTGISTQRVVVAPWSPVITKATTVHEQAPDTGRVQLISCAHHSVVGDDSVVGVPWDIATEPPPSQQLIAIVLPAIGYSRAAERINEVLAQRVSIAGIIVANDEAVLIAARISQQMPVVDGVDIDSALGANQLFIEVRPVGHTVRTATDVWAMHTALPVKQNELESLGLISRWVKDERAVILGLFDNPPVHNNPPVSASVTWSTGETVDLFHAISCFGELPVGAVQTLNLMEPEFTADVWGTDVTAILADRGVRASGHTRSVVLASLARAGCHSHASLDEVFGVPVSVTESESAAAALGARTTPGLSDGAIILDIGGGTIDLVGDCGFSAAGAGELLSTAVAQVLDLPRGAADWIKRGPAWRLESPQVLLSEDGSRSFASTDGLPVVATNVGALITPGPSGFLPFGRNLQPAEWRIIRQTLKQEIIARNVARILRTYKDTVASSLPFDIVIVGGPAADDELLPALGRQSMVGGLGRGNVAGKLGHRYAVAYGLTLMN